MVRHDRGHVLPPSPAHLGAGDGLPARLILDLHVGEQLARLRQQEDRVVRDAVRFEHRLELGPDRAMAPLVLGLEAGSDRHHEGLADHFDAAEPGAPLLVATTPGTAPASAAVSLESSATTICEASCTPAVPCSRSSA